jgi:LPXTG-motif cell wall-anchored protein
VTVEAASEQAPPAAEEPVVEQPVVEQPVVEEPVVEEPVVEEPVVEEPVVEEPVVEESVVEEPAALAAEVEVAAAKVKENAFSKKVYVCKYTGTPGPDEVLQGGNNPESVSINAIDPKFEGNPLLLIGRVFSDAQGFSRVIAVDDGQGDPGIEACAGVLPTYVQAEPPSASKPTCDKDGKLKVPADTDEITYESEPSGTGPGDYVVTATAADGLTLTDDGIFEITVKEQLTGDECAEIEDVALLPDTGGEPMWMFPVGGAMALGGVLLLRATRRTATSEVGGSGNPGHSLALVPRLMNNPVKVLKEAPARVATSTSPQVRSEWAAVAGGLALAAIAVYFRSRFR